MPWATCEQWQKGELIVVLFVIYRWSFLRYVANEHREIRESVRFHIPRVGCAHVCNPSYFQRSAFLAARLARVQMEYLLETFGNSSDLDFDEKPGRCTHSLDPHSRKELISTCCTSAVVLRNSSMYRVPMISLCLSSACAASCSVLSMTKASPVLRPSG